MMSTINPTPWERRPSLGPSGQTLPPIGNLAALNGSSVHDHRDSGNWSLPSSQRASNISEQVTLPPIEPHARNSPGEHHNGHSLYAHTTPTSNGFAASTTSLQSTHTTPPGNNHYHPHNAELPTPSPSASRRSSFDSRLGNLQLSSPVNGTPAASQVSLNNTLLNSNSNRDSLATQMQRDRGIQSNSPNPPSHHHHSHDSSSQSSNPFIHSSIRSSVPSRTAPPIVGSSRYPYGQASHPNAPSPTKGLPWAFPDPEIIEPGGRPGDARTSTSSLPGSAASSMYGGPGIISPNSHQMPPIIGLNGHMGGPLPQIHHHALTARRPSVISENQQSTPYSRTPELRVSHKLAERKRRKEMKDLFDELRESLPAERGGKSSKWEVLTKAIEFVGHQKEVIVEKTRTIDDMRSQLQRYQKELEAARAEVQQLRQMQQQCPPTYHPHPSQQQQHSHDGSYHSQQQNANDGGYHGQSNHGNGPVKMQGLEQC